MGPSPVGPPGTRPLHVMLWIGAGRCSVISTLSSEMKSRGRHMRAMKATGTSTSSIVLQLRTPRFEREVLAEHRAKLGVLAVAMRRIHAAASGVNVDRDGCERVRS